MERDKYDFFGHKLRIGDKVAFLVPRHRTPDKRFTVGTIVKFTSKLALVEYYADRGSGIRRATIRALSSHLFRKPD